MSPGAEAGESRPHREEQAEAEEVALPLPAVGSPCEQLHRAMGPATDEGKRKLLKEEEQAEVEAEEVNRKICSESPLHRPQAGGHQGRPQQAGIRQGHCLLLCFSLCR
jgi:hypothetical protein